MSFYLRKSVKIGPFRLNLSKSGIGVSAGIKGIRIGAGPKGNYIHMGRGGIYYRKTLSPGTENRGLPKGSSPEPASPGPNYQPQPSPATHEPLKEIETGDVLQMTDSSFAELIEEINSKRKRMQLWPIASVLGLLVLVVAHGAKLPDWGLIVLGFAIAGFLIMIYWRDKIKKAVVLFYHLDPAIEKVYENVYDAFGQLASCKRAWNIGAEGKVRDSKYHAGASSLVKRLEINPRNGQPSFLKTNIDVPILPAGNLTLYFFPDKLLVSNSNSVAAISYKNLEMDISKTTFIEDETVPSDSLQVGKTWKYVNKRGGPDRRFKDNRELPMLEYESFHLKTSTGLNELFHFSRKGATTGFKNAISTLARNS